MRYIDKYLITRETPLIDILERLGLILGTSLFVHDDGVLVGSVSDGDVRRWIIDNKSIDAAAENIMYKAPVFLHDYEKNRAKSVMTGNLVRAVPIVDDNKVIVDILTVNDLDLSKNPDMTADEPVLCSCPVIMMAGGKGTRLYPYTRILPKPLIPIGDIPIAEHIIEQFSKYGCKDFYIIVNHMRNMIKAYFSEQEHDYNIEFVDEDVPLGTGGGLSLLKGRVKDTFVLTNCDILIKDNLYYAYQYHKDNNNLITMVCALQKQKIPYGVVDVGKDGQFVKMEEKPEMSFFTNTGCYFAEPRVIDELNAGEHVDFPEIIEKYRSMGEKIGVFPISPESWLDMGQPDKLNEMKRALDNA